MPDGTLADPLIMYQGKNFAFYTTVTGADDFSSGYTARAEMRPAFGHTGTATATFTCAIHPTIADRVDVTLAADQNEIGSIDTGYYVFDIEIVNDSDATDVIMGGRGYIEVRYEVTQS